MNVEDIASENFDHLDARKLRDTIRKQNKAIVVEFGTLALDLAKDMDHGGGDFAIVVDHTGTARGIIDPATITEELRVRTGIGEDKFEDVLRKLSTKDDWLVGLRPRLEFCTTHKEYHKPPVPCPPET